MKSFLFTIDPKHMPTVKVHEDVIIKVYYDKDGIGDVIIPSELLKYITPASWVHILGECEEMIKEGAK